MPKKIKQRMRSGAEKELQVEGAVVKNTWNKTAWLFLAGTKRKLVKSLTGRPQLPSGA